MNGDSASRACLIRLGFNLKLPADVVVEWARLIVGVIVAPDARGGEGESPKVLSVYPARVEQPITVVGRIAVDANGKLTREQISGDRDPDAAVSYDPFVLGWTTATGEAAWMWLPANETAPVGSDALFMSVTGTSGSSLRCRRSLHAAVRHVDSPDYVVVEQIAETIVLPVGRMPR